MKLYRAMCEVEFQQTLKAKRPAFLKRYKWFSPSLEFVKQRVMDGKFNNSKYKQERYLRLVRFTILPESVPFFEKATKEWLLDRRRIARVRWLAVEEIIEAKC